ncbi:store-operated calcium entry-associated regulatory factor isoform X2 [Leucoraja erinacea]|uniref:store-operated calcium entry-associated regulatory factor isoform X2 n=1 Tax=Leucoraja erinaceus TaxID=7782 RepID=UPI0024578DFE|nr:store-operated calcium entry-associated regulatory factor isoform X2 [Leucoraja erinacea]
MRTARHCQCVVGKMAVVGPLLWLCLGLAAEALIDSERVLLREVQSLTLYSGRYTNGRRSSPVPQLQCVGGTASCTSFIPQVVQCYNKGWDGYDVQWECKADMDIAYRFGAVTVSCEGYNYPEDPYILRGSCGLEYVIDLTKEGIRKKKDNPGYVHQPPKQEDPTIVNNPSDLMLLLFLFCLAYLVYRTCLRNQQNDNQSSPKDEDVNNKAGPSKCPPPPGFKPEYTGSTADECHNDNTNQGSNGHQAKGHSSGPGFSNNHANQGSKGHQPGGHSSGPGFWTGVGAGGFLGYLLGSRRSQPSNSYHPFHRDNPAPYTQQRQETNWKPEGTGSRTVSGFGGTKRR